MVVVSFVVVVRCSLFVVGCPLFDDRFCLLLWVDLFVVDCVLLFVVYRFFFVFVFFVCVCFWCFVFVAVGVFVVIVVCR